MKKFFKIQRIWRLPAAIGLMAIGLLTMWLGLHQTIAVEKDGQTSTMRTPALTLAGALRGGGITLNEADQIIPGDVDWFWNLDQVSVSSAREVTIQSPEETYTLVSSDNIPANWMKDLGIRLYPEDRLLVNGAEIDPEEPIEKDDSIYLQYAPAKAILIEIDDQEKTIYTQEPILGRALEKAGFNLRSQDWLSVDLMTLVEDAMRVEIRRAKPVSVDIAGEKITGLSSAETVGAALLDLGIPLQNLDRSLPMEHDSLPEDRHVEIQRVNETVSIAMEEIAHEAEYVEDPDTPLDQISVIEPGQDAIFASRERVKLENGEVIWQESPIQWQASKPKDSLLGVGTKIDVQTAVIDGQTLAFWRKVSVYATSYSPCRSGVDGCLYGTATGILPVQKGVVAVTPRWLSVTNGYGMWGQSVYIPGYGYGVIADSGGGIPGTPWIDLAYSDDEYVSWGTWTTMYFLTPAPAWAPPVLYP
jgi:uncharacterized protein YabE (DUF348 family)